MHGYAKALMITSSNPSPWRNWPAWNPYPPHLPERPLTSSSRSRVDSAAKTVQREVHSPPAREFALLEYLMLERDRWPPHGVDIYDDMVSLMSNVVDSAIYPLRKCIVRT